MGGGEGAAEADDDAVTSRGLCTAGCMLVDEYELWRGGHCLQETFATEKLLRKRRSGPLGGKRSDRHRRRGDARLPSCHP